MNLFTKNKTEYVLYVFYLPLGAILLVLICMWIIAILLAEFVDSCAVSATRL